MKGRRQGIAARIICGSDQAVANFQVQLGALSAVRSSSTLDHIPDLLFMLAFGLFGSSDASLFSSGRWTADVQIFKRQTSSSKDARRVASGVAANDNDAISNAKFQTGIPVGVTGTECSKLV
ncbi:MAG: hypothetical protein WBX22_01630 [Silvibacterium sp.]